MSEENSNVQPSESVQGASESCGEGHAIRKTTVLPPLAIVSLSTLPSNVSSPAELQGEWFVSQIPFQHETRAIRALSWHGIGWYLPLVPMRTKRKVFPPPLKSLFAGYLFVCARAEHDAYGALKLAGAYNSIDVSDQKTLIKELDAINCAIGSGLPVDLYPELRIGRECEIIDGPLKHQRGVIESRDGQTIVSLRVTILGQSCDVEMDVKDVRVIE